MSMMETARAIGIETGTGTNWGRASLPGEKDIFRKLEATEMKGQGRAKCFTGEAKVKQETNEISMLRKHPPLPPLSIKDVTERPLTTPKFPLKGELKEIGSIRHE
jgi:hypothetical protein